LPILDRRCSVNRESESLVEHREIIDRQRTIINVWIGSGVSRLLRMILGLETYEHVNKRLQSSGGQYRQIGAGRSPAAD
ncbi:MAG: hypothetical protein KDA47_04650, partial [Planctomycetales bacterium]|nr:hypothetical protein [Planctomycetales bacterium]